MEIKSEMVRFFSGLLSSNGNLNIEDQNCLLDSIPSIPNENQNKLLTAIPSSLEIKQAVFSFEGDKAPSLDSFPTSFFQEFWEILKNEFSNAVKEFFKSSVGLNLSSRRLIQPSWFLFPRSQVMIP